MGNKQTKKIDVTDYDHGEWNHVGSHRSIAEIVQSSKGRGQAEGQVLHFDPKLNLQKEIEIYQYRKDQDNALVKCIAVHVEKTKTKSICGDKHVLKVLTERIPLRLNQLPQLTFAQSIYALSQSLRGYKDCYNKVGPFQVTHQMIGINNDGQVKVWVNPDFAQNHPIIEKPLLQTSGRLNQQEERVQDFAVRKDQAEMVKNIIRLIQSKSESGRFPQDFTDKIYKNSSSFDQAFKTIESYTVERKMFVPDRIMNMNIVYPKGKYFTPGDQYARDQNDPLYRQRKQFSLQGNNQNIQPLQGSRSSNPIKYQNQPQLPQPRNQQGRIHSPILSLYQQQGPVSIQQGYVLLHSPNGRQNNLHSNVTFNVISPEQSTLVFNSQSCVYPHEVLQRKI